MDTGFRFGDWERAGIDQLAWSTQARAAATDRRTLGKSVAKEDSSSSGPGMCSGFHSSAFQWSMPAWSHGLSRRYRFFPAW